ncbi:MAG: TetR/AcrR family transcriptional regulator [Eubacteriales bacterium]|nr:TetR/AcrR family transcriptional regulator [Eubacteriales bacterium]
MTGKGDQTRQMILEKSKALLMDKGYHALTMSCICAQTGLSRGGLYRYFSSTEEIFLALLGDDKDHWLDRLNDAMEKGSSAKEILRYYLSEMKKGILAGEGRLSLTAYEYVRTANREFAFQRYETALAMTERLLAYGQARGEYAPFDSKAMAAFFLVFMDGLRISGSVIPFSSSDLDGQLKILEAQILVQD